MLRDIQCEKRTYQSSYESHEHGYFQMIMSLSGKLDLKFEQNNIVLGQNHLCLIENACKHGFKATENNAFIILDIPTHLFDKDGKKSVKNGVLIQMDEKWRAIRYLLQHEMDQKDINTVALRRLFEYFKPMLKEYESPSIAYLNQHYDKPLNIDKLARLEHYSGTYFHKWFKEKTGETPRNYLQNIRLEMACKLLLEADYSMFRIALEVGYHHQSSLTKAFYKKFGISPLVWKKNKLGKKFTQTRENTNHIQV